MNETSAYPHDSFTLKEKIQYGILGILVIGGSFYLGRKLIRQSRAKKEEEKTFDDSSPATYAKQIRMAFDNDGWWGTDIEKLRQTLRTIPSRQVFQEVIKSYDRLYNSSLLQDMKKALQSSQYNEMIEIVSAKPQRFVSGAKPVYNYLAWARRLKAAFDKTYGPFPGTDEKAIKAVFLEIPTQSAFQQVSAAYKKEYGDDLIKALKSELEFWEYPSYMKMIYAKPK